MAIFVVLILSMSGEEARLRRLTPHAVVPCKGEHLLVPIHQSGKRMDRSFLRILGLGEAPSFSAHLANSRGVGCGVQKGIGESAGVLGSRHPSDA